jgi:hypothetical protein
MYKTLGIKWLLEVFCPASAFATADSDEARNPQRFIPANVGNKCKSDRRADRYDIDKFKIRKDLAF